MCDVFVLERCVMFVVYLCAMGSVLNRRHCVTVCYEQCVV